MKKPITLDDLERSNRNLKELRTNLRRITVFYEPALDGQCSDDENDRRAPNTAGEPGSLPAISARADAYKDLHFWCRFILDEVNNGNIETVVRPEIRDMAAFIERWSTAVIDQWPDDADVLRKDARRHAEKLENLARGWSIRRIEIGSCPEVGLVIVDGVDVQESCTGGLWAVMQSAVTLLPKQIICDKDGNHKWSPSSWRDLGRRLDASSIRRLLHSPQDVTSAQSNDGSLEAS